MKDLYSIYEKLDLDKTNLDYDMLPVEFFEKELSMELGSMGIKKYDRTDASRKLNCAVYQVCFKEDHDMMLGLWGDGRVCFWIDDRYINPFDKTYTEMYYHNTKQFTKIDESFFIPSDKIKKGAYYINVVLESLFDWGDLNMSYPSNWFEVKNV